MAINKVIDKLGNTLIDLTSDNIKPNQVLQGTTFHGADGQTYTGTLNRNESYTSKYTFIDYDGTIMYTYTDDELDALTELPPGPNYTNTNLTFKRWNWTLADLKAWNRNKCDRPVVGPILNNTSGKTYITLVSSPSPVKATEVFCFSYINPGLYPVLEIDWGDGSDLETYTVNTSNFTISHTFEEQYMEFDIEIDCKANADNLRFGTESYDPVSGRYDGSGLKSIVLGNIRELGSRSKLYASNIKFINIPDSVTCVGEYAFYQCYNLQSITIPDSVTSIGSNAFTNCSELKSVSIPNSVTSILDRTFSNCYNLAGVILPDSITNIRNYIFNNCYSLEHISIPNGVTSIPNNTFYQCRSLKSVSIPNSVTTLASNCFCYCYVLEITIPDSVTSIASYALREVNKISLAQQTKVVAATGQITAATEKLVILVPSNLFNDYKGASNWSNYAEYMVGV